MKKRFLLRRGMLCGVLACFFLLGPGLDSEALARAGKGRAPKGGGASSSKSYQQTPGSAPSSPQKNYQPQIQQPQPQPPLFPPPSHPPAGIKTGFFSGFTGGLTGAVWGGMLFRSLGITVPGWGEGFGMADIFLILFILGILLYEGKRLRNWRAAKAAAIRAGRPPSPYTLPVLPIGGNRQFPYMDNRRPARPPRIR